MKRGAPLLPGFENALVTSHDMVVQARVASERDQARNAHTEPENAPGRDPVSTRAALIAARAKIANPDHYVKGFQACDADGKPCRPGNPDAVRWSLDGALGADVQTRLYLTRLLTKPVFEFEEAAKTTHADVLVFIDSAIARLERVNAAALAPAL